MIDLRVPLFQRVTAYIIYVMRKYSYIKFLFVIHNSAFTHIFSSDDVRILISFHYFSERERGKKNSITRDRKKTKNDVQNDDNSVMYYHII